MGREKIEIRKATPADETILSELIAAAYGQIEHEAYDPEALAAAMPSMSHANAKLLASGTYYVAEVDGIPAACGGWTRQKPGTGELADGVAHIRHFATHPAHLRKGLARTLLDHCLTEAGDARLKLMKSQSTLPAEPFYAAAGFVRVRMTDANMGSGVSLPVVEMERTLP